MKAANHGVALKCLTLHHVIGVRKGGSDKQTPFYSNKSILIEYNLRFFFFFTSFTFYGILL